LKVLNPGKLYNFGLHSLRFGASAAAANKMEEIKRSSVAAFPNA